MKKPDPLPYMIRRIVTLYHSHWEVFNSKDEVVAVCRTREDAEEAQWLLCGKEVYHG